MIVCEGSMLCWSLFSQSDKSLFENISLHAVNFGILVYNWNYEFKWDIVPFYTFFEDIEDKISSLVLLLSFMCD